MQSIKTFEALIDHLRVRGDRKRVVIAWPKDTSTQMAVNRALEAGFINAIFIGCSNDIKANKVLMRHHEHITLHEAPDPDSAAEKAVELIHNGEADILVKGLINTDNLLRVILNREHGILKPGRVLTHITACSIPRYGKLLFFSDAAVIPYPTNEQRTSEIKSLAYAARAFGIKEPRIALIHCTEKVDGRHFPYTENYRDLIARSRKGEFGQCIIDGPLDLKTACDYDSLKKKNIDSPIRGEADCLLFPDIVSANVFYKAVTLFSLAATAAVLQGTMCPVVLPSRGDSDTSKFYSLALAAL